MGRWKTYVEATHRLSVTQLCIVVALLLLISLLLFSPVYPSSVARNFFPWATIRPCIRLGN